MKTYILPVMMAIVADVTAAGKTEVTNLNDNQFETQIKDADVYLVDVRTPEEFAEGHITGATNIDVTAPGFIDKAKKTLPADKKIAVYCKSGKRSAMASAELAENGFKVLNLEGGLEGWKAAGKPVTQK